MAFLLVPLAAIGGFATFVGLMMGGKGDKRDIADIEQSFVLRVNGSSIDRRNVHKLHDLTANFTSASTAIFHAPSWPYPVKGNYYIDESASTNALIRGDFSFALPPTIIVRETTTADWIDTMFDGGVAEPEAKAGVVEPEVPDGLVRGQFVTYDQRSEEGRALKGRFRDAYERREDWQD